MGQIWFDAVDRVPIRRGLQLVGVACHKHQVVALAREDAGEFPSDAK